MEAKNPASHGLPIETSNFTSHDGTRIVYDRVGTGALPVLLSNGLGGDTEAWYPLLEHLMDRCTFFCLDHRGMFRSDVPDDINRLTMRDHAEDLEALVRERNIRQAVVMGWSMGAAISLEFFRNHPQRVKGFIFLNGADRLGLRKLVPLGRKGMDRVRDASHVVAPITGYFNRVGAQLVHRQELLSVMDAFGMVDKHIDLETGARVLERFLHSDPNVIMRTTLEVFRYSAKDLLPRVRVPVLVVNGERDKLVTPADSERMADALPDSHLVILPRATHYALLEFPDIVSLHVESFLEDRGFLPTGP